MEAGITLFTSSAQEKLTLAIDALENGECSSRSDLD
jgi:hypothetical protein